MIKKYSRTFSVVFLFFLAPVFFAQERAVNQKPESSTDFTPHHYYEQNPVIGKAEISKRYKFDLSETGNRIDVTDENSSPAETISNYDSPNKNYIEYTAYSRNYFRIDKNENSLWNGKHWNYSDFPLKVFVIKSDSKLYKSIYADYIDYAFKIWEAADSRIKFSYTSSSIDADIIISFEDNLMVKYDENYLGITDYETSPGKRILRAFVEIGLLKFDNIKISDGEIKATIIHEIGHSLGMGHSSNHVDLMYPYIKTSSSSRMTHVELSKGDIEAVKSVLDLGQRKDYTKK